MVGSPLKQPQNLDPSLEWIFLGLELSLIMTFFPTYPALGLRALMVDSVLSPVVVEYTGFGEFSADVDTLMEDTMTGVAGARLGPSTDVDENSLLSVDGINFTSNWGFCSDDTVTEIKITLSIILDGPWKQSPASSICSEMTEQ